VAAFLFGVMKGEQYADSPVFAVGTPLTSKERLAIATPDDDRAELSQPTVLSTLRAIRRTDLAPAKRTPYQAARIAKWTGR